MAKLVVLSATMAGRSHELTVDKTTIGRVDDNTFQIADPSVSSHHCEVLVQGDNVLVKDLNSTNGTFINGEKITEGALKPGQSLRLGQIELRMETEGMPAAPAPAPATSAPPPAGAPRPATAPSGKRTEQTAVMQRGVSLDELQQGRSASGFDTTSKAFSKKSNQTNRWFLIGGIIAIVVISLFLLYAFSQIKK